MSRGIVMGVGVLALVGAAALGVQGHLADPFDTGTPLIAGQGAEIAVIPPEFDPASLPDGWIERRFVGVTPTAFSVVGDGVVRCVTDASGSILARDIDVAVAEFPALSWAWKVTRPILSDLDEATRAGDDHPVRLFLRFVDVNGAPFTTEIIWANRDFADGDVKTIDGFYHLVAAGPDDALNIWHPEAVDLPALVRALGRDPANARLRVLGVFCDSDDTGTKSEAFVRDLILTRG